MGRAVYWGYQIARILALAVGMRVLISFSLGPSIGISVSRSLIPHTHTHTLLLQLLHLLDPFV